MADRSDDARAVIRRAERWAFAIGFFPAPVLDAAAATIVQLNMINKLARLYELPYSDDEARPLVTALLGGLLPTYFGANFARAAVRFIPGVGPLIGLASLPTSLGAATRLVGKLVVQHFEAGGTLGDFDLRRVTTRAAGEQARAGLAAKAGAAEPAGSAGDDLTRVSGVGPSIAGLLRDNGIWTYAALASASVSELQAMLDRGGRHLKMHDPSSWPSQAAALAAGG